MAIIQPFKAVRPVRNKVCIVPSFSFETYSLNEVNRIIKTNPYSYLNIIGSSYIRSLPKSKRFKAIRKQYDKFKKKEILIQDIFPFLYVMRIIDTLGNQFVGIVGLTSIEEYKKGNILKHEQTLKPRVKAFSEYLKKVRIQSEPVMLTYAAEPVINRIVNKYLDQVPEYEFSMTDGTVFEVWMISDFDDIKTLQNEFSTIDKLYIADGHHRLESTLMMQEEMKINNPYHTGNEAYNFLLTYFIPFDQLKIYPFHRGLVNLNGLSKESFMKRLSEKFHMEKISNYKDPEPHEYILYIDGEYYRLKIPDERLKSGKTDVEILNDEVIVDILKIKDPRNNKILRYHQGKLGLKCVMRDVKRKDCRGIFFLHPLTFSEIKNVADAGKTLPPKSTYIDPKLLTGLFVYEF